MYAIVSENTQPNFDDIPRRDGDKLELVATEDTIERVSGVIFTKTDAMAVDYDGLGAICQSIDLEVPSTLGEVVSVELYTYPHIGFGLICWANVDHYPFDPKVSHTTRYEFHRTPYEMSAEKFERVYDKSKLDSQVGYLFTGTDEDYARVRREFAAEDELIARGDDFARELGIQVVSESELKELERLILAGRVV
jgi:hypothetical protein